MTVRKFVVDRSTAEYNRSYLKIDGILSGKTDTFSEEISQADPLINRKPMTRLINYDLLIDRSSSGIAAGIVSCFFFSLWFPETLIIGTR